MKKYFLGQVLVIYIGFRKKVRSKLYLLKIGRKKEVIDCMKI